MPRRYATDIITFYHPQFWGLNSDAELQDWVVGNPDKFWDAVLGVLAETGVTGVELTFAPGSIENVIRTFGSGKAFKAELDKRGLSIISSFIADPSLPNWRTADDIGVIVADAERRASFLVEVGADMLVTGLPMRKTFGERPAFFVDAPYMTRMAEIAHSVGEAVSRQGVKLAIHTESNSSLWLERDIDLFMSFTDPNYVWLCPDSCHIVLGGGDPVAVASRHAQRIALAHWKDAVGPIGEKMVIDHTIYAQQQRFMCGLGDGVVDWMGWSDAMLDTPGNEIVLIELDAAADPVSALRAGKAFVEGMPA
jgi:sugar phosphate isomerase/epimerase